MEDRLVACINHTVPILGNIWLAGVFDGHGGTVTSSYLATRLAPHLFDALHTAARALPPPPVRDGVCGDGVVGGNGGLCDGACGTEGSCNHDDAYWMLVQETVQHVVEVWCCIWVTCGKTHLHDDHGVYMTMAYVHDIYHTIYVHYTYTTFTQDTIATMQEQIFALKADPRDGSTLLLALHITPSHCVDTCTPTTSPPHTHPPPSTRDAAAVPTTTTARCARCAPHILIAHVGDSVAIACMSDGVSQRLTVDHAPDQPEERQRILAAGGHVTRRSKHGVARLQVCCRVEWLGHILQSAHALHNQYTLYTSNTQSVHNQYTSNTQSVHNQYTINTHIAQSIHTVQHNQYTTNTQPIHNQYTHYTTNTQ